MTVLAAGGSRPANAAAGGDESSWDIGALAELDVPILQAISSLSSRAHWQQSTEGLIPLDAANQVAIPEFDGRLITVPFSFKEVDDAGLTRAPRVPPGSRWRTRGCGTRRPVTSALP